MLSTNSQCHKNLERTIVTIGLCVKNSENSILEVLDSIFNQDFNHQLMKLVIIDGNSKDRTIQLATERLKNCDIENELYAENEGIGSARQMVVEHANGDYIIWVDGDIIISKDYVRKHVDFMECNPTVGIAKGKFLLSSEESCLLLLESMARKVKYLNYDYEGEAYPKKAMATEASIYRIKSIKQVDGFDKKFKWSGEDQDIEHRIRKAGWILFITRGLFWSIPRVWITWNELWSKYLKAGHNYYYFCSKHRGIVKLFAMTPPIAFVSGLLKSVSIYRLTHKKIAFLLPIQYTFKMSAWCLGYIKERFLNRKLI